MACERKVTAPARNEGRNSGITLPVLCPSLAGETRRHRSILVSLPASDGTVNCIGSRGQQRAAVSLNRRQGWLTAVRQPPLLTPLGFSVEKPGNVGVENAGGCDISTDSCQVAAGVNLRPPSGEPARRPPGMRTVSDSGAVRG